ncbi:MAG: hypothetical protein KJN71_07735 [Acidimicrobiia bacterium]|nr:hypothetical protein [Acidimicrobiia bacterium]NNC75440.1 hypothetical protein [Acidimicrobiia bacterium]
MKLNASSLVSGIAFIVIGIVLLLDAVDVWDIRPALLWPGLLITIGVVVAFSGRTVGGGDNDIVR